MITENSFEISYFSCIRVYTSDFIQGINFLKLHFWGIINNSGEMFIAGDYFNKTVLKLMMGLMCFSVYFKVY